METVAWCVLSFTIVERIFELIVSRRNLRWSLARGGQEFGREHYRWMVRLHTGFFVAMVCEGIWYRQSQASFLQSYLFQQVFFASVVAAIGCQVLRWWIIVTLGHQWNTRVVVVPGMKRVNMGLYRYVKHPNYIVVALEIIVLPLILGAWKTAIVFSLLNAWMMYVRLGVESKALGALHDV